MSERQLRLFAHSKPLLERLGKEFFKAIPRQPGVYLMFGQADRILYIGQTRNLRSRLGAYKNCNPHHTPRKVLRLVHQVQRIHLELCDTPIAAQLRENELLRTHRPKFNRMNTFPRAGFFVGVEREAESLRLWLTNEVTACQSLYGAFKGNTRAAFGALAMLLWSHANGPKSHHDFPFGMLSSPAPKTFETSSSEMEQSIRKFFSGTSDELLGKLLASMPSAPALHRALHESALLTLTEFYQKGPQRTRQLRDQHQVREPLLLQERLDDLIVLARQKGQ